MIGKDRATKRKRIEAVSRQKPVEGGMASVAPAGVKIEIVKATTTSPAAHHAGCSLRGRSKSRRKRKSEAARTWLVVPELMAPTRQGAHGV